MNSLAAKAEDQLSTPASASELLQGITSLSQIAERPFAALQEKPTTREGYGITDAEAAGAAADAVTTAAADATTKANAARVAAIAAAAADATTKADAAAAYARQRGNHTGTQGMATVTGLSTALAAKQDLLASRTAAGTHNTIHVSARTDGIDGDGSPWNPRDGSSAEKFTTILQEWESGQHLRLGVGVFELDGGAEYTLNDASLVGAGRFFTTVRNVAPTFGAGDVNIDLIRIIGDNVYVGDLTLDGNSAINSQTLYTYRTCALAIDGSNNHIAAVRATGFTGGVYGDNSQNNLESFVIRLGTGTGGSITNCHVDGFSGYGTILMLWNITFAEVSNNTVRSAEGWFGSVHGMGYGAGTHGCTFHSNTIIGGIDGFHYDTGHSSDNVVEKNKFYNYQQSGVYFETKSPSYRNRIRHNEFYTPYNAGHAFLKVFGTPGMAVEYEVHDNGIVYGGAGTALGLQVTDAVRTNARDNVQSDNLRSFCAYNNIACTFFNNRQASGGGMIQTDGNPIPGNVVPLPPETNEGTWPETEEVRVVSKTLAIGKSLVVLPDVLRLNTVTGTTVLLQHVKIAGVDVTAQHGSAWSWSGYPHGPLEWDGNYSHAIKRHITTAPQVVEISYKIRTINYTPRIERAVALTALNALDSTVPWHSVAGYFEVPALGTQISAISVAPQNDVLINVLTIREWMFVKAGRTGTTFQINWGGGKITAALAYNASAATIQAAVQAVTGGGSALVNKAAQRRTAEYQVGIRNPPTGVVTILLSDGGMWAVPRTTTNAFELGPLPSGYQWEVWRGKGLSEATLLPVNREHYPLSTDAKMRGLVRVTILNTATGARSPYSENAAIARYNNALTRFVNVTD